MKRTLKRELKGTETVVSEVKVPEILWLFLQLNKTDE